MQVSKQAMGIMSVREDIQDSQLIEELTVLEAATRMPSEYIKVLSGETVTAVSKKEIGFIMRRSDIHSVRTYVKHANSLPVERSRILEWLGFELANIPELGAASIQEFHQRVRQHAGTWPALERETKELSRQMNSFSDSFVTTGSAIIGLIDKVELKRFLEGGLNDLTDEELEKIKDPMLDSTELDAVAVMKQYVNNLRIRTENYIKRVESVGGLAAEFERVLTDELIHEAKSKLDAYTRAGCPRSGKV